MLVLSFSTASAAAFSVPGRLTPRARSHISGLLVESMPASFRKLSWIAIFSWLMLAAVDAGRSSARAEAPAPAAEQDAAARSAFEAGRAAYGRGAFAEALAHFEQAHALSPKPELLYNIGRAADSDGQNARAISAYAAYLDAYPNSENRDYVRARLEKVRAQEKLRTAELTKAESTLAAPTIPTPAHEPPPAPAREARDDHAARPVWKRTWFWIAVGAVVAGGATAGALAARRSDPQRAPADWYILTPRAQ
jgi:tetratricopeptide (TPR) repeat protein